MAIIIKDFEPSGDVVEVQLPGSRKRYEIPTSEVLTVGDLEALNKGDFGVFMRLFPDEAQEQLLALHVPQVKQLAEEWVGDPKASGN